MKINDIAVLLSYKDGWCYLSGANSDASKSTETEMGY
jgi:hypothetical protein